MMSANPNPMRCAIYTRVSSDAGLEQDFNSLDAQREASEAFVRSQTHEGWKLIRTAYNDPGFSGGNMNRPALQKLLEDVKGGLIDVILVYKVDRLTRSLADFAKLVELFDAHGVSFVSVTQAFNTTNSMGRLTLNVLLSFAQFEREVTGERIRDKVAASKKKGIWMGGWVPLGYRIENRKLAIDPAEAETVRMIFRRYLELGSIPALMTDLRAKGILTRRRQTATGVVGGVPFTAGPLSYLLRNWIYSGEIVHKGQRYVGEHEAILDLDVFKAVQAQLASNCPDNKTNLEQSRAILLGRIFDDRGNRMSPSHSTRGGVRHRYYVSRAISEGRKAEAGSVPRVPAHEIEVKVIEALRSASVDKLASDSALIENARHIRIERGQIVIEINEEDVTSCGRPMISLPWSPRPARVKREILLPREDPNVDQRPIRAERRDTLLRAVARGRLWFKELSTGLVNDAADIANREGRSLRSVRMMLSLAFVAPDILEAAVSGTLPRGIGLSRLTDLPPLWPDQRRVLGLKT